MTSKDKIRKVVQTYFKEHRNMEKLLTLFTDDAKIIFPSTPPVKGKDAIKEFFQPWFDQYPEADLTERLLVIDGEKVACEFSGKMISSDNDVKEVTGVNIFKFDEGKIKEIRMYMDKYEF